ncbi:MAG: nuclear transport factor 2 family protein, partial [Actinobacteria bacterium]|nr:nuclear transport factor 2 family protein [Actinomycetota bacterium]
PHLFASALARCDGVSVIGTAPDEGHGDRESWIETYTKFIPELGLRLEGGPAPRGYAEGSVGFAVDQPRFVLPDGSFILTRLTAVLRQEDDQWKIVHLHFSVGVPDEDATS